MSERDANSPAPDPGDREGSVNGDDGTDSLQRLRELARANRGAALAAAGQTGNDGSGGNGAAHPRPDLETELPQSGAAADRPDPDFEITGARPVASASVPTLRFDARVSDTSGRRVYFIALAILLTVEPGMRRYDDSSRARLVELFGEPERWGSTTGSFRWAQVDVVVPAFTGAGDFHFDVPCSYDHEIAATKYFGGVREGTYPLQMHFNGTVYYDAAGPGEASTDGLLQMLPLAWDRSARWELPVQTWREMIAAHYPEGGWLRLQEETLSRLGRHKAASGAPTLDAAVSGLLDKAEGEAG